MRLSYSRLSTLVVHPGSVSMNKSILIAAVIFRVATALDSHAQISFACLSVGGDKSEFGNDIIQSADSGYVIAGYANSFGASNPDFCVVKIDANGNLLWTSVIRGSNADALTAIEQTSDGGYVVGGYTDVTSYNQDFYLAKLNSNGSLEWDKHIGRFHSEFAASVHQTFDGGYAIAGQTNSTTYSDNEFYIVKTDSAGNLQWSKMIGGSGQEHGYDTKQTSDSGYVMVGNTSGFGSGGNDIYAVKLDSAGVLEWAEAVGGSGDETANSVIQSADGGYAIAGYTNGFGAAGNDVYVVKLDALGNISWTKTIGGSDPDYGTSIKQTTDGGYVIGGHSLSFNGSSYRAYIVKLDGAGNLEWTSSAGAPGDLEVNSIAQTFDGGYVVGGSSVASGISFYDFMILKLDASGNSCCPANPGGTISDGGVAISGGVVTDVTSDVVEPSFSDTLVEATLNAYCITTNITEVESENSFVTFPNPAYDQVILSSHANIEHGVVKLYDTSGKKVFEDVFNNRNIFQFSVKNNPFGIYLLMTHAILNGGTEVDYSEKLVINHH